MAEGTSEIKKFTENFKSSALDFCDFVDKLYEENIKDLTRDDLVEFYTKMINVQTQFDMLKVSVASAATAAISITQATKNLNNKNDSNQAETE